MIFLAPIETLVILIAIVLLILLLAIIPWWVWGGLVALFVIGYIATPKGEVNEEDKEGTV